MARRSLLRRLAAAAFAVAIPVAAEPVELPLRLSLDAGAVVFDLGNADVDVQVDPDAEPALRAFPVDGDSGALDLDVATEGGTLTVRRPAGIRGEELRMRVEVTVSPAQDLSLGGRDLSVTVRDARTAEELASEDEERVSEDEEGVSGDEEGVSGDGERVAEDEERASAGEGASGALPDSGRETAVAGPSVLHLALESSQIDFAGVRNAVVEAARTSVWMTRTSGSFALTLDQGSATIRGHQGDLQLDATAAEVAAYDLRGRLEPHLAGGSLDVRQGTGVFEGSARDAVVVFDGWLGYVTLHGSGTTVAARDVGEPRPWNLDGADLLVTLEAIAGPVTANLNGGRFKAGAIANRVAVTATNRADVELDDAARGADVKLSDGATARLADVGGQVRVELNDAELRAVRTGHLLLSGARSRVDAAEVDRLVQLEMTDSDLTLDLTSTTYSSSLKLLGTGRSAVRLAAPCTVRVTGPAAQGGSSVGVSGCDLNLPGQPERSIGRHLAYGGRRPVILAVWLDDGVELEVEGLP